MYRLITFGTTTLESTPGVGTTVKVTVPLY